MSSPRFSLPVRVYYEDTDAGGIVYYANYLRYLERARTEFLRKLGVSQRDFAAQHNRLFVVAAANINYRVAARLDDQLICTIDELKLSGARLIFKQSVCCEPDLRQCVEATVTCVCVDATTRRPARLPELIKEIV